MKMLIIMVVAVAILLLKTWSHVTRPLSQAGILILLVQRSKLRPRAVTAVEGVRQHLSLGPRLAVCMSSEPPLRPHPPCQCQQTDISLVPMTMGAVPSSPCEWVTRNLSLEKVF